MFEVGQLVVCVGDQSLDWALLNRFRPDLCPKRGNVYTVSGVLRDCPECGGTHLDLEEAPSFMAIGFPGRWFRPCRPVNTEKFMEQLLPTPAEQPVVG